MQSNFNILEKNNQTSEQQYLTSGPCHNVFKPIVCRPIIGLEKGQFCAFIENTDNSRGD